MLLPGAEFFKVKTQESHLGIPYECLATEAPDVPKTIQANVIVFGCPPEPDSKTVLLMTPTHFGCRPLRNQTGAELKDSSPTS